MNLILEKAPRFFILSWVLINLLLLPVAVFAESPAVIGQEISSAEITSGQFGGITPIGSVLNSPGYAVYTPASMTAHVYFKTVSDNIKIAIVLILYAIVALVFYGVFSHGLKMGLGTRASLNISVEAIIIIIFAITILGLGLGFIKGMFGKVATQLEELVANEPDPSPASSSQPITLSRESIVAQAGEEVALKIGFYHTGAAGSALNGKLGTDLCGKNDDGICYYDSSNTNCSLPANDTDCGNLWPACGADGKCFVNASSTTCNLTSNSDPDCNFYRASPSITCSQVVDSSAIQTQPKNVNIRDRAILTMIFKINPNTGIGTKLCEVGVGNIKRDITLKIK